MLSLPSIRLSHNQKLILDTLRSEFSGRSFGPEMLECTENMEVKDLTINQITWNMLRLRESGLVQSTKKTYKGRVLNEYSITPVVQYDAIIIR